MTKNDQKERSLARLEKALEELKHVMITIDEQWSGTEDGVNMVLSTAYPFDEDFTSMTHKVIDWVNDSLDGLKKI